MKSVATLIETARPSARLRLPILDWIRIASERRALSRLDDRGLADIGVDPTEARREVNRPFWDLPIAR